MSKRLPPIARDSTLQRVAQTIARYEMFSAGQRVGVAVSGGADSVCLLFALRELREHCGISLSVLHLDHGLRGSESAGDAAFVRSLAANLGLPAIVECADLRFARGNLEQEARLARLAFFRRQIASGAVARVALGHTRSDQAETVLFRFLRGAGTAGLAGIRPITSEGLVRPLIEIERAEVEAFLNSRGIRWREDSTNHSPRFARNRIRHNLLPELARHWNPSIVHTLSQMADWARAEESWWETEIHRLSARLLVRSESAVVLKARDLNRLPTAAARRVVRRAIEIVQGNTRGLDFNHVESVRRLAAGSPGHGAVRAPALEIVRSFDWLRFSQTPAPAPTAYVLPVPLPGIVAVPGSKEAISLELLDQTDPSNISENVYNIKMSCIDWPRVSGPLELRNWRPGDRYQPIGHTGEEKIKDLFQKSRIPLWERSGWPVLTARSAIIWVRKFGPAAGLVPATASTTVLRIRELGNLESKTPAQASIEVG